MFGGSVVMPRVGLVAHASFVQPRLECNGCWSCFDGMLFSQCTCATASRADADAKIEDACLVVLSHKLPSH